jgi:outer membrane protein assembly factor BamE (lipoprotein component of BamABCDE complex)
MKKFITLFTILAPLVIGGCSKQYDTEGKKIDLDQLRDIKIGIHKREDVEGLLGTPSFKNTLDDHTWYYAVRNISRRSFFDPRLESQDVFTITFNKDDTVSHINDLRKDRSRKLDISLRSTPTSGHHDSFFETLFGHTKHYGSEKDDKKGK